MEIRKQIPTNANRVTLRAFDKDGRVVSAGDEVTSFRGEKWIFQGVTGRNKVYVVNPTTNRGLEFFATVFDLKVGEHDGS